MNLVRPLAKLDDGLLLIDNGVVVWIGFQVSGDASFCVTNCLSLYTDAKVGVYNNHIEHHSHIRGTRGDAVLVDGPCGPDGGSRSYDGEAGNVE